jgi:phospholipase C
MQSRRTFLKNSAMLAGAIGMWGTLGDSVRRAMAIEPEPGSSFLDAEHVVILMQENRSFDHCFGSLKGVRGFNDPRAIKLPNGNPVWVQSDSSGKSYVPFRLNIKDTRATWMGGLPHSWQSQVDARNHGKYDRWLRAKRSGTRAYASMPLTMGHYTREDIPFYYELADAFTICDQHFCSSLTGTTPNRLHLWTGTIRGEQSTSAQANVTNEDADYDHEVQWTTFPERLEDHGVSWKIYQNELSVETGLSDSEADWLANFGDNPIEYFKQFRVRFSKAYRDNLQRLLQSLPVEIAELNKQLYTPGLDAVKKTKLEKSLKEMAEELAGVQAEAKIYTAENYAKLSAREKNLHEKAFSNNSGDPDYRQLMDLTYKDGDVERTLQVPKGDVMHQFRKDVETGNLPAVSWIVAPEKFSDHPSSAWYGAWYIAEAMNILTKNPEVWKKTIFILTYDENDGYFDHVPPFVAPRPNDRDSGSVSSGIDSGLEYVELEQDRKRVPGSSPRESPIGLGFRVPMVVASPWSRGGCVCSQVFDHTSVLQFLEKFATHKTGKPITETNISSWRRAVCGDLTSLFQAAPKDDSPLRYPPRDQVVEGIHRARFKPLPTGYQALSAGEIETMRRNPLDVPSMARQEPGVRPSCPLPYELYADGALSADKRTFVIRLKTGKNALAAGCPFTVYAVTGKNAMQVRNFALNAGDRLEDSWKLTDFADGAYHLRVCGPNGFYREFIGSGGDSPVSLAVNYSRNPTGKLNGNLEITATNGDDRRAFTIDVTDQSYKAKPQSASLTPGQSAKLVIDTRRSSCWYDLAVTIPQISGFRQSLAGRVETGEWSISDPAMGQAIDWA